jgi:hypothetical protein
VSCASSTKPATTQTVSDFSGCTYGWQAGSWGVCGGGSGTWSYSAWLPTSGCGVVPQSRTGGCGADTDSGTQARTVGCVRSDGTSVSETLCSGARPATSESCTPASGFSCGAQEATTGSAVLTDTCSYNWAASPWSAPSNTCSAGATQTRTLSCLRSDGATVGDVNCNPAQKPSASQSVSDFSGCTYSWFAGGFGACSGGSAGWITGEWVPPSGCGATLQTRRLTCTVDAGSGIQAQSVNCDRSDGTTVGDSNCDARTRPVDTQSCTPSAADCGAAPATSQNSVMTDACPSANSTEYHGCLPDPANGKFCVFSPL